MGVMTYYEPFIGSEALAAGTLTRGRLRWGYDALLPDVYAAREAPRDLRLRTQAAWLWTGRRGIVAGQAAAARYTGKPLDREADIEMIATGRRPQPGVVIRNETIADDEIRTVGTMRATTPERTALDLARYLPHEEAICHLDRLADATDIVPEDVYQLADRYKGARGILHAREILWQMNGRAISPEESRLRLMINRTNLPRVHAGIIVGDWPNMTRIPLGWIRFRVGIDFPLDPPTRPELITIEANESDCRSVNGWLMITAAPHRNPRRLIRNIRDALTWRTQNGYRSRY